MDLTYKEFRDILFEGEVRHIIYDHIKFWTFAELNIKCICCFGEKFMDIASKFWRMAGCLGEPNYCYDDGKIYDIDVVKVENRMMDALQDHYYDHTFTVMERLTIKL